MNVFYGKPVALPKYEPAENDTRLFAGWSFAEDGEAVIPDGAEVLNLSRILGDTVTLYAIFEETPTEETAEAEEVEIISDAVIPEIAQAENELPEIVQPQESIGHEWLLEPEQSSTTGHTSKPAQNTKPEDHSGKFSDWVIG